MAKLKAINTSGRHRALNGPLTGFQECPARLTGLDIGMYRSAAPFVFKLTSTDVVTSSQLTESSSGLKKRN